MSTNELAETPAAAGVTTKPAESIETRRTRQFSVEPDASDHFELLPTPLWKRSFDIAAASIGLVLLAPLFLIVAIAIKIFSPGPVFFAQRRAGHGGRPFWIFKFRTMVVGAEGQQDRLSDLNEQDGPAFKISEDPRITRVGHWLRSSSIDELPQLWNVLKGDMSLVGPRPLPCKESECCQPWQKRRLATKPGITCIWQVQDRSIPIHFDDWMRMDLEYNDKRSLKQDLYIMYKTVLFMIGRRGS